MEDDIFRIIFENATDAILYLDMEGNVVHANRMAMAYVTDNRDLVGARISAQGIFDEGSNREIIDFFEVTKKAGKCEREMKVRFVHGPEEWVKLTAQVIKNNGGEPRGVVVNISNVSKLKRYAEVIKESQRRYKLVVDNLHEGLCLVDSNENIIYTNPALGRMLGYTVGELMEMNISEIVPDEQFNLIREKSGDRKMGRAGEYDTQMLTRAGEIKRIKISAAPWFDQKGKYRGSVGLIHDMTDSIKQNIALRESEEKYRATVEQSADNIYIYDIESKKITESNTAIQELLGYTRDEMIGMNASDFVAHGTHNIERKVQEVMTTGRAIIGERKYQRKDGSLVDVDVSANLITQGRRKKLCVVSRDITERKRYQRQLIVERNRAEFYLDLLAHDMGNMLHGIKNGLDLYRIINNTRKKNEILDMLESLAERSIRLSRDIQTFSKAKDEKLNLVDIDLKESIMGSYRKACDSVSVSGPEPSIEMEKGLTIKAEPMIEEAFFNLFHNSLQAQKDDDIYIGVRARKEKGKVKIEITDHGGGISDEMKPLLFDRFSEDRIMKLSGIGMTIVKMVIERYEGTVHIEDNIIGDEVKGTRFVIDFPAG